MDQQLADRLAIRDVIEAWAIARDSGDWETFRGTWHVARRRIKVRVRKAQRVEAAGKARAERPPMIADEIVKTARAIHQNAGPLSEATIVGLGRRSADHRLPDPVTGTAERALRLVRSQTETGLSQTETDRDGLFQPRTARSVPPSAPGT